MTPRQDRRTSCSFVPPPSTRSTSSRPVSPTGTWRAPWPNPSARASRWSWSRWSTTSSGPPGVAVAPASAHRRRGQAARSADAQLAACRGAFGNGGPGHRRLRRRPAGPAALRAAPKCGSHTSAPHRCRPAPPSDDVTNRTPAQTSWRQRINPDEEARSNDPVCGPRGREPMEARTWPSCADLGFNVRLRQRDRREPVHGSDGRHTHDAPRADRPHTPRGSTTATAEVSPLNGRHACSRNRITASLR